MIEFNTHPDRYRHWTLRVEGPLARLELRVDPEHPFRAGYELKLNSYDLGVDIELADAVNRVRFEHPQVKVVVVTSAIDRVFCAGANIGMLAASTHPFKVNFCKFTNETRLSIEDASRSAGLRFLAAVNGPCAGGGYELAIACDEIHLVDDNSSAVSLPEVALLGVLPGTGGLTRLVDKRKVRRDLADVFSTLAEGVRGKKAKKWRLVDASWARSQFGDKVAQRAKEIAASGEDRSGRRGIAWTPVERKVTQEGSTTTYAYRFVELTIETETRAATLTMRAPDAGQPRTAAEFHRAGAEAWFIRAFRELDDALCQLRFEHEDVSLVLLHTRGSIDAVLAAEAALVECARSDWLAREIVALVARVLRRYELTARSFFAVVDKGSAFGGVFFELALAGDRIYALDVDGVEIAIGPLSNGLLPMTHGLTRLQSRFLAEPERAARLAAEQPRLRAADADGEGLVTFLVEDVDWEDDLRIAVEERASLSPDALTGMEASLRFGGAETCDSKIFGRLSAWQNWIFTRPNATGERGALVSYGKPESASFDWRRT
ncbi:MAG: benzoyl-CoA-dihydrodiol lyase [Planctomycetes bacterium]|nr:benzoyl-CoA-dihydrodiol lyase [Planctomycetota bacterium]